MHGPTRGGSMTRVLLPPPPKKRCGCLKSSWRPSSSWWSWPLCIPSSCSLPWNQTTGNGNNAVVLFKLSHWQHRHCRTPSEQKNCNILLDKDLCDVKKFWKVGFQNKVSISNNVVNLCIFSGQTTKPYSHFTSVARHFISSKWTLCA